MDPSTSEALHQHQDLMSLHMDMTCQGQQDHNMAPVLPVQAPQDEHLAGLVQEVSVALWSDRMRIWAMN